MLRSTGFAWDLRKTQPYSGYQDYDFEVQTWDTCDAYGRFRIRLNEMWESLKIVEQAAERLAGLEGAPVMVADKKIAWPSQLAVGTDGMGNSLDHIKHIMGESMEALIHHFKLVTEGFRVPAGQAYVPIESPRGELGAHVVSDGGTRPFRAHFRDPSFTNLQATSVMSEGGMVADVIVADRLDRPGDGRGGPMTEIQRRAARRDDAGRAAARSPLRYPQPRSALLPMLHLVQSVEGRVTSRGIEACADILGISAAEVSGVATFYTMYKRRPVGDYHVGVCTNTLCAVMGGDAIFERLKDHLDIGNDETTEDGRDHPRAPRVQRGLRLRAGDDGELGVHGQPDARVRDPAGRRPAQRRARCTSTRGPRICTWREAERVLAGFPDDRADEGPAAGPASLLGLQIARANGWTAPRSEQRPATWARPRTPPSGAAEKSDATDDASAMRIDRSGAGTRGGKDEEDK